MVLYFSGTGNTEYIAQEIARRLDDECVSLLDRIKTEDHSVLHSEKPFVICAPVYVCEMPRFMMKYLKKQEFSGSKDVYFIFTSGGYCGPSGPLAKSMFRKKKMNYMGHAEFTMPRNYVANTSYPMLSPEEAEERILGARKMIDPVAEDIRAGRKLTAARHVYLAETLITVPFNPIWTKFKLRADDFYVTEGCVGCGRCVRLCPLNNIALKDRKPVWGDQCSHCMACIANCPTEAIEYGNITQGKERYTLGKYRHVTEQPLDD